MEQREGTVNVRRVNTKQSKMWDFEDIQESKSSVDCVGIIDIGEWYIKKCVGGCWWEALFFVVSEEYVTRVLEGVYGGASGTHLEVSKT